MKKIQILLALSTCAVVSFAHSAVIYDYDFTEPGFTGSAIGGVAQEGWNGNGTWNTGSGTLFSIGRGFVRQITHVANPLAGEVVTMEMDIVLDITNITGSTNNLIWGLSTNFATVTPGTSAANLTASLTYNLTSGWTIQAESNNTTTGTLFVENADIGLDPGNSDFISDNLTLSWSAIRSATDGNWSVSASIVNNDTAYSGSTATVNVASSIPLSAANIQSGLRTFSNVTTDWQGGAATLDNISLSVIPEPSAGFLLIGAGLCVCLLRLRQSQVAGRAKSW